MHPRSARSRRHSLTFEFVRVAQGWKTANEGHPRQKKYIIGCRVNMAQRRSQRLADQRTRFGTQGLWLGDDPIVKIAEYSGKPPSWNRYFNNRYGCSSTNQRYRVLKENGGACPMEARIMEPSANGVSSMCCTSRLPLAVGSHAESLWFIRTLKQVYQSAGNHQVIPHDLVRVVRWAVNPANASDVGAVPDDSIFDNAQGVVVDISNERVLDILKLATMCESYTMVSGRGPSGSIDVRFGHPALWPPLGTTIRINAGIPAYDDVVRVVNETKIGTWSLQTSGLGSVYVTPVRAKHYEINGAGAVNIADISNHFRTGILHGWNLSTFFTNDSYAVLPSDTDTQAEMIALFKEMTGQQRLNFAPRSLPQRVVFRLHDGQIPAGQIVPAGFTSVALAPGMVFTIGHNFFLFLQFQQQSVSAFHSTVEHGVFERIHFSYMQGLNIWIKFELEWDIVTGDVVFDFEKVNI